MGDYCPECGMRDGHWPGCVFDLSGSEVRRRLTQRGYTENEASIMEARRDDPDGRRVIHQALRR